MASTRAFRWGRTSSIRSAGNLRIRPGDALFHPAAGGVAAGEQQPDLIVLTGDFVSYVVDQVEAGMVSAFSSLSAPDGVLAILGNHDVKQGHGDAQMEALATSSDAPAALAAAATQLIPAMPAATTAPAKPAPAGGAEETKVLRGAAAAHVSR